MPSQSFTTGEHPILNKNNGFSWNTTITDAEEFDQLVRKILNLRYWYGDGNIVQRQCGMVQFILYVDVTPPLPVLRGPTVDVEWYG